MPRWLYSLLLYIVLPFALLRLLLRGGRGAASEGALTGHLSWRPVRRTDAPLWLHAASVGEVRALAALVHALGTAPPPLLITVGTPAGRGRARELFGARHEVRAAPWDLPGATRRFIAAVRPRGAVFIETELWPNLIAAAHRENVPLVLVSARLSERSLTGYRRFGRRLMQDTVRAFAAIGTQSEADRARFIRLGASPDVVSVTGNVKFDLPLDAAAQARGAVLRARWAPHRPLWVAGSTHPGEEQQVLLAQRQLLAAASAAGAVPPLLAFAPRHPGRFADAADWLARQQLAWARSSAGSPAATVPPDVLLIDAMGELSDWYAAADIAFVGGSLVPVGGHNLLEPAVLERPVLTGPHTYASPDAARCLIAAGGARVVNDATDLAAGLAAWLGDSRARLAAGAAAAAAVAANRGAAARALALLTARGLVPAAQPAGSAPSGTG